MAKGKQSSRREPEGSSLRADLQEDGWCRRVEGDQLNLINSKHLFITSIGSTTRLRDLGTIPDPGCMSQ